MIVFDSQHVHFTHYIYIEILLFSGTIGMAISYNMVFYTCINCENSNIWVKFTYYSIFLLIGHTCHVASQMSLMALIPELTSDETEREGLNAVRYSIMSYIYIKIYYKNNLPSSPFQRELFISNGKTSLQKLKKVHFFFI